MKESLKKMYSMLRAILSSRRSDFFWWVAVFSATLLTHVTYIYNGFTWLDHADIEAGVARVPLTELGSAFLHHFGQTGFYRPFVTVLHSFDFALYGQNASGYHATNVILHLLVTCAAVYFCRTFFKLGPRESFVAAFIVGISPLSWLVVGSISYRSDLLVVLFTMLSLIFYCRSRIRYEWWAILLFAFTSLLALFSKETSFFWIPSLILLHEIARYVVEGRIWKSGEGRSLLIAVTSGISIAILYLVLRIHALPHIWSVTASRLPFSEAVGTRLWALGRELTYLVSPLTPTLSDATPITSIFSVTSLGVILLSGFFIVIVAKKGLGSSVSRAILFIGIALAPALNILPLPRFTSPHYVHFAGIGFAALVVILGRELKMDKSRIFKVYLVCFILWIFLMFVSTSRGGLRFENDTSLFIPEISKDTHFSEGHYYVGTYFFEKGDTGLAYEEYVKSLPDQKYITFVNKAGLYINLARVELEKKLYDDADMHLQTAARLVPSLSKLVVYNRAVVASRKGDYKLVVSLLLPRSGKWPSNEPDILLSEALMRLGKQEQALEIMKGIFPAFGSQDGEELIRRFGSSMN